MRPGKGTVAVVFLASDDAAFTVVGEFVIDGGMAVLSSLRL